MSFFVRISASEKPIPQSPVDISPRPMRPGIRKSMYREPRLRSTIFATGAYASLRPSPRWSASSVTARASRLSGRVGSY